MRRFLLAIGLVLAAASPAYAHPGHIGAGSVTAGFLHPLSGADHMLAMLAVGVWAKYVTPRTWWVWPSAFVGFMAAGFAYGAFGGVLPGAESLIIGSMVVLGAAIAIRAQPGLTVGAALVGLFAIAHGYAHGAEIPASANATLFAGGFVAATSLLHIAGVALAALLLRLQAKLAPAFPLVRLAGAGIALAGISVAVVG